MQTSWVSDYPPKILPPFIITMQAFVASATPTFPTGGWSRRSQPRRPTTNITAPNMLLTARPATPVDRCGFNVLPIDTAQALSLFSSFFDEMTGSWNSERTYHYLSSPPGAPTREESQTTFDVRRLSEHELIGVLQSNDEHLQVSTDMARDSQGFNVSFLTKMGSMDQLVRASTNLAFAVEDCDELGNLKGSYYRDLGYEEAAPIKAKFVFDAAKMTLGMTTFYTKVVSVDQIELVNPKLRLRKIVNYRRPRFGEPLSDAVLIGYGVETKGEAKRLVEENL